MADHGYRVTKLADIPPVKEHGLEVEADWKPVRHQLGIDVFGINAYTATEAGQIVVEEHHELDEDGGPGEHEVYFVQSGQATFTVGDESFDAPAGTLVYLGDPALVRKAVAADAGTT